jgi:hypothetical protein
LYRKKCPKWRTDTSNKRFALGISPDFKGWTQSLPTPQGVPDCPRVQQMVNTAWADRKNKNPTVPDSELRKGFFCQVDSSITMTPWGASGIASAPSHICVLVAHTHVHIITISMELCAPPQAHILVFLMLWPALTHA